MTTAAFVTLALSGDGRTTAVYGPFASEREADAFGLAYTPVWTIMPLDVDGDSLRDVPTALDFPDCRACQMWKDAGASWPRPCKKHYGGEPATAAHDLADLSQDDNGGWWWACTCDAAEGRYATHAEAIVGLAAHLNREADGDGGQRR